MDGIVEGILGGLTSAFKLEKGSSPWLKSLVYTFIFFVIFTIYELIYKSIGLRDIFSLETAIILTCLYLFLFLLFYFYKWADKWREDNL